MTRHDSAVVVYKAVCRLSLLGIGELVKMLNAGNDDPICWAACCLHFNGSLRPLEVVT